ncbi:hypothetical protein GYMLUDRAFT_32603 [Collybiopsis luxurians FD-317 M1]|nr:hypothetical protein GYMLUDRAFT_32603 [Collybiopsis luxurians FD-317 M1]
MSEGRSKPISTFSFRSVSIVAVRHVRKHIGLGLVCSIAYFDPGNWGVDLQAGAVYGYRLLFIVLVAGLIATFLQVFTSPHDFQSLPIIVGFRCLQRGLVV